MDKRYLYLASPLRKRKGGLLFLLCWAIPLQGLYLRLHALAILACFRMPGLKREHPVVRLQRFVEAAERSEHVGAIVQEIDVFGQQRERAIVARQRLIEARELRERAAAIVERARIVGAKSERAVVAFERLLVAAELGQHGSAVVVHLRVLGIERERFAEARDRLLAALERVQHDTEIAMGFGRFRITFQRLLDQFARFCELPLLLPEHAEQVQRV